MKKLLKLNLHVFDDSGADSGVANPTAEGTTPIATESQGETTERDKSKEFEALIRGEFKEEYDKRFNTALDKRFKNQKSLEQTIESQKGLLDMLAKKYGVDATPEAIQGAIEADDGFFAEKAAAEGLSVEQYRNKLSIEMENERFRRAEDERKRIEGINQVYKQWEDQAESAREFYPELKLEVEAENEQFLSLLENGIDVKTAYEVIHHDEIMPAMMQHVAAEAKKQTVSSIQSKGRRPQENGATSGAVSTKLDVSKLSDAQLDDIKQKVMRGEKISF